MNITVLHSDMSSASVDFLKTLGVPIPQGEDVSVSVDGHSVRVVSGHDACVSVCKTFPGPPFVIAIDGETERYLAFPQTWNDVVSWLSQPDPAQPSKVSFSRLDFMSLFTFAELVACEEASKTNPVVAVIWRLIESAEYIDISDQRTKDMVNNLVSNGLLTAERAADILAGKSPSS